jgi:hypothetical protein
MESPHDRAFVGALIEAIATRPPRHGDQLAAALFARCWPGGSEDRDEPDAREWLRRWRPGGSAPRQRTCSCDVGRCLLCN